MTIVTDVGPDMAQGLSNRLPTDIEADCAAHAAAAIAVAMETEDGFKICGRDSEPVEIARAVGDLIIELLGHVSAGKMVKLVPVSAMLTTQQAAFMLNVSRPFLTKLLKQGEIAFVEVGTHRRVPLSALLKYREERFRKQEAAMKELSRLGQEFDRA